jgi:hypothetical protein
LCKERTRLALQAVSGFLCTRPFNYPISPESAHVIPKFTECSDDAYLAAGHWIVAHDLEWDPLNMEDGEEILVKTFTFDEALAAIRCDYRCDPQAVLALWLYAGKLCLSVG